MGDSSVLAQIELLLNQLYSLAEVSPVSLLVSSDAPKSRFRCCSKTLLISTLAKVNRLKLAIDPQVKKALKLASKLETLKKVPHSVEFERYLLHSAL